MLIPIRHENMSARRWPVITLALIVINLAAFLATNDRLHRQAPELGKVKAHILLLAAMHPELTMQPDVQQMVAAFRDRNPNEWARVQNPSHQIIDAWDAHMRLMEDPGALQADMDSLTSEYRSLTTTSLAEQYAFVPAHPTSISYLTANFLHGGWLHLIGNMWFLWLAGFVLEDAWGRVVYSMFYLAAGAAALQFHAWLNPGSLIPTLGASGAVAALMGAFLVRFPRMNIQMMWLFMFRAHRFSAPAYALLPVWLLMEVFNGTLFGKASGVAHWAHVGGFLFGAIAALGLRYSGLERKMDQAIEEEISWQNDPEIVQAGDLLNGGQPDAADAVLEPYLARNPDSIDAWGIKREILWRKNDVPAYLAASTKLCELHLKARDTEAAWQDYNEFLEAGGDKLPSPSWLELCRAAEQHQQFDRALEEYQKLAASCPSERAALTAQLAAARLLVKKFNRPQDAVRIYGAVAASPVPHLDLEPDIQAGMREANAALEKPQPVPVPQTS